MTTWLSPNFSLEEAVHSQTAVRLGLDNTPGKAELVNMYDAAEHLELVRALLGGHPLLISSWFRAWPVNTAVGGSATSDHPDGTAIDFTCPRFGSPLAICRKIALSSLRFDQLIEEGTWVHIGFDRRMRRQIKTKRPGSGYQPGLRAA